MMRTAFKLVLLALCALPPTALHAAVSTPAQHVDPAGKCDAFSQAGRRECFGQLAAESAAALKKAEAHALRKIDQWFENDNYKHIARTKMRASAVAFVRYRKARCDFASSLRGGAAGNAHEISRLACVADMNARRALELTNESDRLEAD